MSNKKEHQEKQSIVPISEQIEDRILMIRGQKVMLDEDLATVYGVSTKRLNEQVKRNVGRFPQDFIFQLTILPRESPHMRAVWMNRGKMGN